MKCPVCNVDLLMAERCSVEIDYCPQCRGQWLDRGELDKIIENSAGALNNRQQMPNMQQDNAPPMQQNFRRDDDDDDDDRGRGFGNDQRPRKKEGFFGRLFDSD